MYHRTIKEIIQTALAEDVGEGDFTSEACIDAGSAGEAVLLVKEDGVIAGIDVAKDIFQIVDPGLHFERFCADGSQVKHSDKVLKVNGEVRSILKSERIVLNCMQRMSGIATKTFKMAELIRSYPCRLIDTRKTTPGFRLLEKMAVRAGGGSNHRFGLDDMILIKDNHIDFAGGIENAILRVNKFIRQNNKILKIEIEARSLKEVKEILAVGLVDRIMLDNFSPGLISEALILIGNKYETEASGNIDAGNIESYASTGINFISSGSLTHSYKSLDLSLKAVRK